MDHDSDFFDDTDNDVHILTNAMTIAIAGMLTVPTIMSVAPVVRSSLVSPLTQRPQRIQCLASKCLAVKIAGGRAKKVFKGVCNETVLAYVANDGRCGDNG